MTSTATNDDSANRSSCQPLQAGAFLVARALGFRIDAPCGRLPLPSDFGDDVCMYQHTKFMIPGCTTGPCKLRFCLACNTAMSQDGIQRQGQGVSCARIFCLPEPSRSSSSLRDRGCLCRASRPSSCGARSPRMRWRTLRRPLRRSSLSSSQTAAVPGTSD